MKNINFPLRKLTACAMLCALAVVLVYLIHFPLLPAAMFLEYDPADVPIFFASVCFGPWWGLAMTAVVSVVQGLTVSAQSGIIGIVMHFVATGSFALISGLVCGRLRIKQDAPRPSLKRILISFVAGVLTMTAVMAGMNLLLTPIFMQTPVKAVLEMLVPIIIPFNLLKAGINAAVAFLLYTALRRPLEKATLI